MTVCRLTSADARNFKHLFEIEKAQRDPSLAWTPENNRKITISLLHLCLSVSWRKVVLRFSDPNNCCEFLASTGVNLQDVHQQFFKTFLWCFLLHVLFILFKYFCRKVCGQFYIWILFYYILFMSVCKSAFQFDSICFVL